MVKRKEIIDTIIKSLDTAKNHQIIEAYNYVVGCSDCPSWRDCKNEHMCADYIADILEEGE